MLTEKTTSVFKMYSLQLVLAILLLKIGNGKEITFKNVTVAWWKDNTDQTIFGTADNLKKIIPSEEEMYVGVSGYIPVLYEQSVYGIPNLKSLHLENVSLKEIKPGAFGNLPLLQYLVLSDNNLTEIKSGTFTNLNLSETDLTMNLINSLQPGAFKNVTLKYLRLNNNKLTEFTSGVFENVTLTGLHLYENHIHTIAPNAFSTISMDSLNLFYNQIEKLDPETFTNSELTTLILSYNRIKLLRAGDLKNLPQLERLSLKNNNLTEIPEGVFNNTKITDLELHHNKIVKIASKAFNDMSGLRGLNIAFNKPTSWDNGWLDGSSQLSVFRASFNQIAEIPDEAFKNYPRLYYLALQGNKIAKLSIKAFRKLGYVEYLSLNSNEIDTWGKDMLVNVSVGTLDLRMNKLKCIEGDLDQVFGSVIDGVYLSNNPWSEGCAKKVEEFLKKKNQDV